MGFLKKLTKPLSKFLDKIIPNELKPALPYLSAFAPFIPGMQGIMGSGMLQRGLMSGGANILSQLAQEGSEGEFSPLSVALASGVGALGAQNAPEFFQGMQRGPTGADRFGDISVPYSDTGIMASVSDAIGKGGASAAIFIGEAGKVLRPDETKAGLDMATLKALSVPISHGTADLAMADARRALRDYEREMAANEAESLIDDEGRRRAIRAAMEAAGHLEETILDALAALGLRSGGIVSLRDGGRIGLLRGGDPDDYSQQQDVGTFELQQEEGVPIGPMVQEDRQKQLLKAFAEYQAGGGTLSLKEFAVMWMRENAAGGGRIGYFLGDLVSKSATAYPGSSPVNTGGRGGMGSLIMNMIHNNPQLFSMLNQPQRPPILNAPVLSESIDFIDENRNGIDDREEEIVEENAAGGGMMGVLPKGKEMDYRGGGVIPIGSRERADDVPARLSKNEFVMTADAVKAAGGGSVNRGAKKMYNLMHNLEARV